LRREIEVEIISPRQLWEDFDKGFAPEETVVKESADGRVKHLYFNGLACEGGGRVRVYARLIMPGIRVQGTGYRGQGSAAADESASKTAQNDDNDYVETQPPLYPVPCTLYPNP